MVRYGWYRLIATLTVRIYFRQGDSKSSREKFDFSGLKYCVFSYCRRRIHARRLPGCIGGQREVLTAFRIKPAELYVYQLHVFLKVLFGLQASTHFFFNSLIIIFVIGLAVAFLFELHFFLLIRFDRVLIFFSFLL